MNLQYQHWKVMHVCCCVCVCVCMRVCVCVGGDWGVGWGMEEGSGPSLKGNWMNAVH